MMEIITAKKLDSLSTEKQREFEGLLPLLVKKLILHSCTAIDSIRMPHGEDIFRALMGLFIVLNKLLM